MTTGYRLTPEARAGLEAGQVDAERLDAGREGALDDPRRAEPDEREATATASPRRAWGVSGHRGATSAEPS